MRYTEEQKQEVINYYNNCKSLKETYIKFGDIYPDNIRRWCDPHFHKKVLIYNTTKRHLRTPEQKTHYKEKSKRYFVKNREQIYKKHKEYIADNINKVREYYRKRGEKRRQIPGYNKWQNEQYKSDPLFKIKCLIRGNANRAIKGKLPKSHSSLYYIGCTVDEFKKHIESLFKPGMNWENHGNGEGKWNIDHIIPLDTLNDTSSIYQILKISNYKNLQPLWSKDNLIKSYKHHD